MIILTGQVKNIKTDVMFSEWSLDCKERGWMDIVDFEKHLKRKAKGNDNITLIDGGYREISICGRLETTIVMKDTNDCDHAPMLIYGNNQDLIDNPVCRRCGRNIVWCKDKFIEVES